MRAALALAVFLTASVYAAEFDTVIVSDGGPGPFGLGRLFIDTSSIRVSYAGRAGRADTSFGAEAADTAVPQFTFIDRTNAILFSEPIPQGVRLRVRCRTLQFGLPKMYSLFDKRFAGIRDTLLLIRDSLFRTKEAEFAEENLTISGYKSINVSMGNLGNMNIEQALDVSLSGDIAPQTTLSGHLTDQGTNLEGTREVSEFDRIYVALDNPSYSVCVGDQYVTWPIAGILSGQKKLKGISAGYYRTPGDKSGLSGIAGSQLKVKGFGAIAGGKFTIQTVRGKSGIQGPYYLTGNGEQSFIMPLTGTVSLFVNGRKCSEGYQADYTVDYELGSVTFTPKILIRDNDIIRIEYEYKLFDYQRTLAGANAAAALPDSSVVVEAAVWNEADDKNRPIDMLLTPEDRFRMEHSGDTPPQHSSARPVLSPQEVARESALHPLYTSVDGHWAFTPYRQSDAAISRQYYTVWFAEVGPGKGAYAVDQNSMDSFPLLGKIYSYVGPGAGTATDSTPVPLPQSMTTAEVKTSMRPAKWLSLTCDVAGLDNDKNLFSDLDDRDNRGSASTVGATLGRRDADARSVWLSGSHLYITPGFTREVMGAFEGGQLWDDTSADFRSGLRQTWDATSGATVLRGTFVEATYGQYRYNNELHTDRIAATTRTTFYKQDYLEYQGSLFRHVLWGNDTRRDALRLGCGLPYSDWLLEARDEWRTYPGESGRGEGGAGATVSVAPLSLTEAFFYTLHRRGAAVFNASDTGRSLAWDQSFSRFLVPSWQVQASTHYLLLDIFNKQAASTILASLQSDVSLPKRGITSHQEYRVNIERASTYVQVPVYAQPGQGDYVWNADKNEYEKKANGDYFLQQQEVYDSTATERVRKTRLNINWAYSPTTHAGKRLLNDLAWYGSLTCEEHLSLASKLPLSSWVPGYFSLFSAHGLSDSAIRLADLSYRQSIEWNPDSLPGYHGKFYIEPAAKKIRDYHETSVDWGGGLDRTFGRWTLSGEAVLLSAWRRRDGGYSMNEYDLFDRSLKLTEKFAVLRPLSLYVKETAGWAQQVMEGTAGSGTYYRVVPGVEWQIFNRGSADASYTYSQVDMPGIVDPRIAQGFTNGISHSVDVTAHATIASHFSLDASYHGEFGNNYYNAHALHVFSMQLKAFL